jgi:hypothetical protein
MDVVLQSMFHVYRYFSAGWRKFRQDSINSLKIEAKVGRGDVISRHFFDFFVENDPVY